MPLSPDDVFIPGGLPDATYVSRDHLNLENDLQRWVERRQKPLLSVSGPTKSGKTVLLRRLIPSAIWLSGGVIYSTDDFWTAICEELEVFTDHALSISHSDSSGDGAELAGSTVFAAARIKATSEEHSGRGMTRSRSADARSAARRALREAGRVVIIDDFHYVDSEHQLQIVRGLKDLIFEGLGVAVAAVPHRSYDVVRVEKEMTGRVQKLDVEPWGDEDLALISRQGFSALNVQIDESITLRMVQESFGSPHLMQTHCLNLCDANGITQGEVPEASAPNWEDFFAKQASATSKSAFDLLKTGPRTRTDRIPRRLKSGIVTDIYGAVLAAIEQTGPRTTLTYDEIRGSLRDILESDLPQRHEITNVLEQMTNIAKEKIEGEPVLEYDAEYSTLHLADPFFAYYLRWASPTLKNIAIGR